MKNVIPKTGHAHYIWYIRFYYIRKNSKY